LVRRLTSLIALSKDARSSNLFPKMRREIIETKAREEVFLQTPDRSLGLYLPFFLPDLEAPDGLSSVGSSEDNLCFSHTNFLLTPFKLRGDIPHFMSQAPLNLTERKDFFESSKQGWVPINGDQFKILSFQPSGFKINQKSPPALYRFSLVAIWKPINSFFPLLSLVRAVRTTLFSTPISLTPLTPSRPGRGILQYQRFLYSGKFSSLFPELL